MACLNVLVEAVESVEAIGVLTAIMSLVCGTALNLNFKVSGTSGTYGIAVVIVVV